MKYFSIYLLLTVALMATGCQKELPRDNPLDINNPVAYKEGLALVAPHVTDDNAIDGIVNSHNLVVNTGEHVQFMIEVKNTSTTDIANAIVTLLVPSNPDIKNLKIEGSSVTGASLPLHFNHMNAGEQKLCDETIDFDLPSTKDGEDLVFTLLKKDKDGNTATENFKFTVNHFTPSYDFALQQPVLSGSDQSDGKIRAGAVIKIKLREKNTAGSPAGLMRARFVYNTGQISKISPDTLSFGKTIASGNTTAQQEITISISPSAPAASNAPVEMDLFDIYGNIWKQSFNFTVGR